MLFDHPISITEALKNSLLKRVMALSESIGSADIRNLIPAEIRDAAFWSARTPFVDYLAQTSDMIQRLVQPDVRVMDDVAGATVPGESISPAQVRAKMKQLLEGLSYRPAAADAGGLKDLSSDQRINLIIDTQLSMQRGKGSGMASQNPTTLKLFPADELWRAIYPRIKARDWQTRWNNARADLDDDTTATYAVNPAGPFVALKNDPIWTEISAFGNPYPPFDYNSGMRVRDVGRAKAIRLGVLAPDQTVQPVSNPAAAPQAMSLANVPAELITALQQAFGGRASVSGDRLTLAPAPVRAIALGGV